MSTTSRAPESSIVPSISQSPRLSASLVVVNSRNEVLLVHRNPKATAFGGVHVFPGGNLDEEQDGSLAITAIRETFEESGLLLALPQHSFTPSLSDAMLDDARHDIHQKKLQFQTFLRANHLKADAEALLPFTQWITPIGSPRRFHTQFYVSFLPTAPSSGFSSGSKQERLPKDDGGQEVIEARFVHPKIALDECRDGKIRIMPPQYYILSTLADILQDSINTADQRQKVETLSRGSFGAMVINPLRLGEDENGRTILTYEGDETRGGSRGRLHRVLLKMQNGAPNEISLIRNFNIYSEIEPRLFASTKL